MYLLYWEGGAGGDIEVFIWILFSSFLLSVLLSCNCYFLLGNLIILEAMRETRSSRHFKYCSGNVSDRLINKLQQPVVPPQQNFSIFS